MPEVRNMGSTTIVRSEPPLSAREEAVRPRREEVREQLARLLANPLFQHSKHYPGFLRYVMAPTVETEGLRDLLRCRDDLRCARIAARHRVLKQLLRHGRI